MANSKHYRQSANVKSILYPGKEPKKLKKIKIPVQDISIIDMYDSIDQVPEEKKGEFIRAIMAD
jgi:citrate lyase beta subunit